MSGSARPAAVLALDRVSFAYAPTTPALRDVSLAFEPGATVALLGANGCGKSTLLKLLDGLLHPDSGSVTAFGEPLTEAALREPGFARRFRRRVGLVFHNADAQLFSASVREEIAFGPLHLGLTPEDVEQRVADVAAMLDVTRLLERPPFQLSAGEKRRVALAAVLVLNPEVLLLDEPTSGLDPRSQRWLAETLVTLRQAGKTILAATHDLEMAAEVADRAVVLGEDHTVAADGRASEVLADIPLLLSVNLIHEQSHWHGTRLHAHPHAARTRHEHAAPAPESPTSRREA